MNAHELAQVNIARMRAPLEDPLMAEFREQLDAVNAVADAWPGFVWRLQTDDGDATSIRVFEDALILLNMSVWQSLDALHDYVYRSAHVGPLRARRQWFEPMQQASVCLWWVRPGERPTPEDGRDRLNHLRLHGPTPHAFTFRAPFDANGRALEPATLKPARSG
jgi:hypothetical protein